MIDLRSDTVTRPTKEMKEAMMAAPVGDDVFGEDPTVNALEEKAAAMFNMEKALFCPSGTMTNQIAIRVHTQPQSEVICDAKSHIYNYEGGGIAYNSFSSVRLLHGDRGRINASAVKANINNPDDVHAAVTRLVAVENTVNKGGGSIYQWDDLVAVAHVCRDHQLGYHLDGARLFNALVESDYTAHDHGHIFDSISICLSKGLGCPVGSILTGSSEFIRKARRIRKVLGGGMRQAGMLAAAGIYALDHHIERLKEDHKRARALEAILKSSSFVENILPVDTNIVIYTLAEDIAPADHLKLLEKHGILAVPFGPREIRLVTHLDFTDDDLSEVARIFKVLAH